jgi:Ca2+-binding RTX toxin-like protein
MAGTAKLVVGTALIALFVPAGAQAATVRLDADVVADRVHYKADPGEANDLTVTGDDEALTFVDAGAPITAGAGCSGGGAAGVPAVCSRQGEHTASLEVALGNLADSLDTAAVALSSPFFFIRITAGDAGDTVLGGVESEIVSPGKGPDQVSTGAGDDRWTQRFDKPDGDDRFDGGAGEDTAEYGGSKPVRVRLDGLANDGPRGESDNLLRVENLRGTGYSDLLAGGAKANRLFGEGGDDRVLGGRGDDLIEGLTGRDVLRGGRGDDVINAKRHILGEGSGRDRVDCGRGDDIAVVERRDRVRDCETVRRR